MEPRIVATPVQEKPLRFGSHTPLAGWQIAPLVDLLADLVDEDVLGDARLLTFCVERESELLPPPVTRGGNGDEILAWAPAVPPVPGRLAILVEFVMHGRFREGRIDDRLFDETHWVPHCCSAIAALVKWIAPPLATGICPSPPHPCR